MYGIRAICRSPDAILKLMKPVHLSQITLPYSMLDKLPTIEPGQFDTEDDSILEPKSSKAMRTYLQKSREYQEFMSKKHEEFQVGKRHLANMMGVDPETFTQEQINEAIEYLFPCALFIKKARPIMKPPQDIFPPKKEAQFDESGRPFHFLFYTGKPDFYQILHNAVNFLKELNDIEDKVIAGLLNDKPEHTDLYSSRWLALEELERIVLERLTELEYNNFVAVMERLLEHPFSYKKVDFIMKYRSLITSSVKSYDLCPMEQTADGINFVSSSNTRKRAKAEVKVYMPGTGKIIINAKDILYFKDVQCREEVCDFLFVYFKRMNRVHRV